MLVNMTTGMTTTTARPMTGWRSRSALIKLVPPPKSCLASFTNNLSLTEFEFLERISACDPAHDYDESLPYSYSSVMAIIIVRVIHIDVIIVTAI